MPDPKHLKFESLVSDVLNNCNRQVISHMVYMIMHKNSKVQHIRNI